ncbi:hypothetical protein F3Y22_tig00110264pilonHSYRG00040 [Hibiscus syriacus]|uniref:Uncharacterized protein n=1 Tax=Hibiscus syriacus TaxID=106335 RepID=A0A6A3B4N1_HIBSY|nr:hypothetical protein F3Y22_tig00110264pilonHSYRG00040 [Hibiscus syriacus]
MKGAGYSSISSVKGHMDGDPGPTVKPGSGPTDATDECLLAINQAAREAEEDDDGNDIISLDEIVQEPVLPRTRNRPKREV